MDRQVTLPLHHTREALPVRERRSTRVALAAKATEYRDVPGRFASLVDDNHPPLGHARSSGVSMNWITPPSGAVKYEMLHS